MANKVDSNVTGLAFAEEASLRVLPGTPIWYPLEPNGYKDFGGQIATVARNPINPSRQRKKGVTTDLDASGGFTQDITPVNTPRLLQGFFFADAREKPSTQKMTTAAIPLTSVSATQYLAAAGLAVFLAGHIVLASNLGVAGNNGVKNVTASAAGSITVAEALTVEASPPAAAKLDVVGFKFPAASVAITMVGGLPRMTSSTTDLTTLGFVRGEWIYLGGDGAAGTKFLNNNGFARINQITTGYLEFDKTSWTPAAEISTGLTISIFMGLVIKNESVQNLIKRRTYNVERTLGQDTVGTMSEYLVGAVPNELTVNMPQADKITMDMSFVAVDNEQRTGTVAPKAGTRIVLPPADAFNTSNDFARIKLAIVTPTDAAPVPLFAYATEISLTVNNNVTPNKAVGVLGAFDTSAGTFEVGGKLTAYFADITAVQAVRNNSDVTIDLVMVKNNTGLLWDIPLLSLGDGRLSVEQDQPITLPLDTNAAESKFGHTLLFQSFPYLPNAADV
jgi:hypothetical protein